MSRPPIRERHPRLTRWLATGVAVAAMLLFAWRVESPPLRSHLIEVVAVGAVLWLVLRPPMRR